MRQRGNLYVYIGAAVAGLAMLSALFFGVKSYLNGVDERAFERGQQEAQIAYEKRDNEALAELNKRLVELQAKLRAVEAEGAKRVAEIDKQHQREIANAKDQAARDAAAARSGDIRLRDHWRDEALACSAERDRSAGGEATGATGERDGTGGQELSREASEFLLGEANRADGVVEKLHRAQEVIREYRRIVNGNQEVPRAP